MASQATIQGIIDYYVNLLIIQYHNKPKAMATINLIIGQLLVENIAQDIQNGYAVQSLTIWQNGQEVTIPPAVGVQLDVLGKYAGVTRYYRDLSLIDYFGMIGYGDPLPTESYGFSDYSTFSGDNHNGTLVYGDFFSQNNQLFDSVFLQLIQYAIRLNTLKFSFKAIDNLLYAFFGTTLRAEYGPAMVMNYFINVTETPLMLAIIYKKLLPTPLAVGYNIVSGITGRMFGLTDYDLDESPFAYGFSDYADYASLSGQVLTYDQMVAG